jgi:Family of unknown function (DUF6494)
MAERKFDALSGAGGHLLGPTGRICSETASRGTSPSEMDRGTYRDPNQNRAQRHRRTNQEPDEYAVVGHYVVGRFDLVCSHSAAGRQARPLHPVPPTRSGPFFISMTIINCWPFPVHLPMPASVLIRGLVTQQQLSIGRTTMDEEALNTSVRKFLKKLGVTAQREIEMAVRDADAKGLLKGSDPLPAKAVVTVGGIDLKFEIDGDIELG